MKRIREIQTMLILLILNFICIYSSPLVFTNPLDHSIANNTLIDYTPDPINILFNSTFGENEEDHPCEQKTDILIKYFFNQTALPPQYSQYYKFLLNSGTGINDYGDYFACKLMNYSAYYLMSYPVGTGVDVSLGICYFKECDVKYLNKTRDDIAYLLKTYRGINITADKLTFSNSQELNENYKSEFTVGFTIVTSFLTLLIILNILQYILKQNNINKRASIIIYDIKEERKSNKGFLENENNENLDHINNNHHNHHNNSRFEKILAFFDFNQNYNKLFNIHSVNETQKALRIFDGVRFLSTGWVVFGHTFVFILTVGFKNIMDVGDFFKSYKFSLVSSGFYAVDVFFYMSGFLLCFGIQKYLDKKINKFQVFFIAIIQRYIRLLPLYLFTLLAIPSLIPFLGDGPNYYRVELLNSGCNKYFWHNLLYVNNLIHYETDELCAGHTWYLANDMQFYIFSLFIFVFLNNFKIIRNFIFTSIFISSNVYQVYLVYHYEYTYLDYIHPTKNNDTYIENYYIRPWNRVTPFIIGLYFCELFLQTPLYLKDNKKEEILLSNNNNNNNNDDEINTNFDNRKISFTFVQKINNLFINSTIASSILFIFSLILINYSVFINSYTNNQDSTPMYLHAFFNTFNKELFVLGLACIVHLTFLGKFTFIRDILSIKIFSILSRLTYGIYLVHISILLIVSLSIPAQMYFKFGDFIFLSLGFITFATILSFFITLLIESPVVNATKMFLGPEHRKKKNVVNN